MVRVIKTEVITPPVDTPITEVTADLTAESVAAATAIAEHYCHRQFLQRTVRVRIQYRLLRTLTGCCYNCNLYLILRLSCLPKASVRIGR